jgi:NADPH-dependent curcumin reductase CurA
VTVSGTGREIHLASRPTGEPTPDNFALVEAEVPEPGDDEVLVRNLFMSVDPYMRGRMNDVRSYVPAFPLGEVLQGGAVGEVVASNAASLDVGDAVVHNLGWRELAVVPAAHTQKVDPSVAALSRYLGILGMPGLTAYVGLTEIAAFGAPDVVFVSAAAGAVGSAAGQFARLLGSARVVGSAGSDDKVAMLTGDLGFDAAFNYRKGPVADLLAEAAPDGIDIYFDNVGGEHLEAAIGALRVRGRIAACGAISAYNAVSPPPGPRNMSFIVGKRLTVRGFIVSDHTASRQEFIQKVGGWLTEGLLLAPESIVDGLEQAPHAFIGMLRGANTGKTLVRIAEPLADGAADAVR